MFIGCGRKPITGCARWLAYHHRKVAFCDHVAPRSGYGSRECFKQFTSRNRKRGMPNDGFETVTGFTILHEPVFGSFCLQNVPAEGDVLKKRKTLGCHLARLRGVACDLSSHNDYRSSSRRSAPRAGGAAWTPRSFLESTFGCWDIGHRPMCCSSQWLLRKRFGLNWRSAELIQLPIMQNSAQLTSFHRFPGQTVLSR